MKAGPVRYAERLYVAWWAWPLPLLGGGLLAAEIHMGYPGVRAWLPYVIMLPVVVLLLLALGRVRVAVLGGTREGTGESTEPELHVGDAHLPLRFAGEIEVIGKQDKRKALGPYLDPAAYVVHRGWIGPVVRLRLTDPADPTPYWLFSTRRPERLIAVLRENGWREPEPTGTTGTTGTTGPTETTGPTD